MTKKASWHSIAWHQNDIRAVLGAERTAAKHRPTSDGLWLVLDDGEKFKEARLLFRKSEIPATLPGKIDNVLGPNTSYNGTIKSDENLRIDCIYQGHIETAGNVIIGPSAQVFADIVANAVQVWGTVCGNIKAGGLLEILPTGRVWGDVNVLSLTIDEGGIFRGQCTIAGNNIEPLKLLDASAQETVPNE